MSQPKHDQPSESQSAEKQSLHARWLRVMRDLRPPKKREPGDQFYPYIAWDDLAERLRPVLAEHGVYLLVSLREIETERVDEVSEGRKRTGKIARVTVEIQRMTEDGESDTSLYVAEAFDSGRGDKAIQKAVTSAVKYWLLKCLCVGDPLVDPDADQEPRAEAVESEDLRKRRQKLLSQAMHLPQWPQLRRQWKEEGYDLSSLSSEELDELERRVAALVSAKEGQ